MIRDINEIQTLATKYSKPQLARMAQMGLIDPTKAVMAGMMIDRITKSNMQAPQQTVAQEALTPMPPQGAMAPQMSPAMQQPMPQAPVAPAGIGALPTQPEPNAGVSALPSGITEMAGGGIVAFDEGGEVPRYGGKEESLVRTKYGRDFDFLPIYVPPKTESPPAPPLASDAGEVFSNIGTSVYNLGRSAIDPVSDFLAQPTSRGSVLRVDPNTGKPVSFGEYMRLQEAERNAAALPAATRIVENVNAGRTPLSDKPPAPAPAPQNKGQRRSAGPRTNQQATNTTNINQQVPPPPPETRVAQEEPAGIASIIPKRPETLDIPLNLGKFTTTPLPVPGKKEIKDFLMEQDEAQKQAGVNNNIYKDLMGDLDTKKGKLANRKQEAIGAALMQTGLGLLGARRGQEFAVLGEAGQRSLQGLIAANERIRETEEKIDDARRGLLVAENDYKRTRSDKALESVQKHRDKIEAMEIRNIEAQNLANSRTAEIQVQVFGKKVDLRSQEVQVYQSDTQRASAADTEKSRRAGAMDVAREQSKSHLTGIELQGQNQLAVQRMQNLGLNRPGETERLMSRYYEIEKTQGKEAAEKWLQVQERISGRGKTSGTNLQEQYADDWNKMDVMQRQNYKNQGITTEQQYIDYRLRMAGRPTTAQPTNVPPVGTIQEWDGKKWKFKGGANTKDNWEQVK